MSFISFEFAIFAGLALLIFHLAPSRSRPTLLLVFSYLFYFTWSPFYAVLLAVVTCGVFAAGLRIDSRATEDRKRRWLDLAVICLLLLLFAFKASAWFPKGVFSLAGSAAIVVPLGLSYYVFKMIGYLLDVYWEVLPAERNFVVVALYGSFFPQIVSGPIQRAGSFFDQVQTIKNPEPAQFVDGARRILFGLWKKIVIADPLTPLVASVHLNPAAHSSVELLIGAYCFAIQLYADFSGITDIAIGLGQLFGIRGPENFDLPFFSPNIQVFWRRWHMSLTSWLADYLFTPLRMALRRSGTRGLCLAIVINTTAIGLWHGLNLTFLAFGLLHGIFMVISVLTLKWRNIYFQSRPTAAATRKFFGPFFTFNMVALSLIFFRAESFKASIVYIAGLIPGLQQASMPSLRFDLTSLRISSFALVFCALAFVASEAATWAFRKNSYANSFLSSPLLFRRFVYCTMAASILYLYRGSLTFIYAGF
jgi:alginate O-acetyltransferase complex protein AlgI